MFTLEELTAVHERRTNGVNGTPKPAPDGFRFLTEDEMCAAIADPNYVIRDLDISPGRPHMFAGAGASMKTLSAQSLLVSAATGQPVWNKFHVRQGKCVHLDYEMGDGPTRRRYMRLARGMGLDWRRDVVPNLRFAPLPKIKLNNPGAIDALKVALDGSTVAVMDSLRRMLPGEDENSSAITEYIDALTPVSLDTGCSIILIHHASTKNDGHMGKGGPRGTSAFYDSCGAVYMLWAKDRGAPVRIEQWKPWESGTYCEDFYLQVEDAGAFTCHRCGEVINGLCVDHPDQAPKWDARWALKISHRTVEEVIPPKDPNRAKDELDGNVWDYIRRNVDCNDTQMRKAKVAGAEQLQKSLERLVGAGRIVNLGTEDKHRWRVIGCD